MDLEDDFALFAHSPLIRGLDAEKIAKIFALTTEVSLEKGKFLVQRDEKAREIFIILEGEIDVLKLERKSHQHHVIATLQKGEAIFFKRGHCLESFQAVSQVRLRRISYFDLKALCATDRSFYRFFLRLRQSINARLNRSEKTPAHSRLARLKGRLTNDFFVSIVIFNCLFAFFIPFFRDLFAKVSVTAYITVPLSVWIFIYAIVVAKRSGLPLQFFGVSLHNWKQSVREGVLFTLPVLLAICILKFIFIYFVPAYKDVDLFQFEGERVFFHNFKNFYTWTLTLFPYCFVIVPAQEFITRGCLQSYLEFLLIGKRKKELAILIPNLLYAVFHLLLSIYFAVASLFGGIFIGWLYSRTHNLLGVWISHLLIGIFTLWIVGF